LYRIIESTLLRAEASGPAAPKAEEKEKVPLSAKQVVPIPSSLEQAAKGAQPRSKIFLITKKNASLHDRPSTQSKLMLIFKPGRKVEKIAESGNWVQVRIWETTTGWVLKDFLEEAPP
jgi:SH3-like domain-containing protein